MTYIPQNSPNSPALQGEYILRILETYFLCGDAYIYQEDIYNLCRRSIHNLAYPSFLYDFNFLLQNNLLCREGRKIYLPKTLQHETSTAHFLAQLLLDNNLTSPVLPEYIITTDGTVLCNEQKNAVHTALSHRLSLILGGAGTGKSSLVQATVQYIPKGTGAVLCAPTGKAARNLADRTHMVVRTVHSVLGICPDDDFFSPIYWENISLCIVDEASMLTLEMLYGLLNCAKKNCRIVLLGDYNQLLSVGS